MIKSLIRSLFSVRKSFQGREKHYMFTNSDGKKFCIDIVDPSVIDKLNIPATEFELLANCIERNFNRFDDPEEFFDLERVEFQSILNKILTASYLPSDLKLILFNEGALMKDDYIYSNLTFDNIRINGKQCYACLYQSPEDRLVVSGLSYYLGKKMVSFERENKILLGFSARISYYFKNLISSSLKNPVSRLYILDMRETLSKINKNLLLSKLEKLVSNERMMSFIQAVLNRKIIPMLPVSKRDTSINLPDCGEVTEDDLSKEDISIEGLPPYPYFSEVLMNLALIDFDKKFKEVFPSITYARSLHEIIVTTSQSDDADYLLSSIFKLFDNLNLVGEIDSIGPGYSSLKTSSGSLIWVGNDGRIHIIDEEGNEIELEKDDKN